MSKSPDSPVLSIRSRYTDCVIKSFAAHPYLWTLAICLAINPFYLGSAGFVPSNALYIEVGMSLAAAWTAVFFICRKFSISNIIKVPMYALVTSVIMLTTVLFAKSQYKGLWMYIAGSVLILVIYSLASTKKYKEQLTSWMIIALGFMLKFYYVFYTSCYTRQNDVHEFGGEIGHAAYMEYILFNHKIPDFDVRNVWQFCHPPLHHIISALWIGANEYVLGVGHDPARESLQTLSLFYSMTIMITAYKIFKHFKLNGMSLYAPLGLVCFHPCFILFSGAINNDVLSVAFMMGAFLCTLKWYEEPKLKEIMKIALCIGFGMMTKLSAALVAPPVAIVFLIVFIKRFKTDGKRLFGQFAAFGTVCVPLGLWFEIKNYVKYRVPFTYVQEMSTNVSQYIGDQKFSDRITDFSLYQFRDVFEQWIDRDCDDYNEFNPLVTLLKNSVFGESVYQGTLNYESFFLYLAKAFFWLAALIAAVSLVLMIYNMFTKCGLDIPTKIFWMSFYLMLVMNFYKMAKDYPFTCTMNFRYITPTVIIGAFFSGLTVKRLQESKSEKAETVSRIMSFVVFVFAVFSSLLYIQVCIPKNS